jgi:hypothetical protein
MQATRGRLGYMRRAMREAASICSMLPDALILCVRIAALLEGPCGVKCCVTKVN